MQTELFPIQCSSQNLITADGGKEHPVNPAGTDCRCRADQELTELLFHLLSDFTCSSEVAGVSDPPAKR